MANKKKDRKLKKIKRREYKQKVKQQQLAKSIKLTEDDLYNEYYTEDKKKRLEEDRLIIENYKKRSDYINLVDKQTFMQLEPQLQAEEFIKAYEYVLNGLTTAKNLDELDYKGLKSLQHDIELYDKIYDIFKSGNYIPQELKSNLYIMYANLKYLSSLVNVGEESRAAFEERQAALNRILEDKFEYEIFKAYKRGEKIDIDFDKYKSLAFRRVDDLIATMNYSSDQAMNYVLSTDYDVFKGEGGLHIILKDIANSKFDSYEKKAKEETQAFGEMTNLTNALIVNEMNKLENKDSNIKDLDDLDVDILRLKSSEFAKVYRISDYYSKNDARYIGELKVLLEQYDNPREVMKSLINASRSTNIVNNSNDPTMFDIKYFIKLLERGIDFNSDNKIELEFGTNNINVENKEEEEYGDIL